MNGLKLKIPRACLEQIESDARHRQPIEACGVLIGSSSKNGFEVSEIISTPNELNSPTRFEINPEVLYQVMKRAETKGLDVVGFYHSHFGYGDRPSAIDLEYMKFVSNMAWLICDLSPKGTRFRAFSLLGGKLVELELVTK
jgi:proteasome lid subunit RPN8/RPN11